LPNGKPASTDYTYYTPLYGDWWIWDEYLFGK